MNLPRDSSDIQIALACTTCNGNGGIGPRTRLRNPDGTTTSFSSCDSCNATGWTLKRPADLSPAEIAKLLKRIPSSLLTAHCSLGTSNSITGEVIEAGTDDSGQPRIIIHTTEDELKRIALIPFYKSARITFTALP